MEITMTPEGKFMIYNAQVTEEELENIFETGATGKADDGLEFTLFGDNFTGTEERSFRYFEGSYRALLKLEKDPSQEQLQELGKIPIYSKGSTPEKSLNLGYVRFT